MSITLQEESAMSRHLWNMQCLKKKTGLPNSFGDYKPVQQKDVAANLYELSAESDSYR